jgi:uncharacterized protein YjeT (DUF2065 family)
MYWTEILTAFSLFLVIEGLVPFMSPGGYRRAVTQMAQLPDNQLRVAGLISMIAGILLLFIVR